MKPAAHPMHPVHWIAPDTRSLLDVGCNAGALLLHCQHDFPDTQLAGIEVNRSAVDIARQRVPDADIRAASVAAVPFEAGRFDCVTCIEVLEHVAPDRRRRAFEEMHRVLRPGGRLVLRTPHAGWFAWLDPNNFRFRFSWLYGMVVPQGGGREVGYQGASGVVWHHHFTCTELLALAGDGWAIEAQRYGGLFLIPLMDLCRWPFYRLQKADSVVCRFLERLSDIDLRRDYGVAAYDVLLVLRRL